MKRNEISHARLSAGVLGLGLVLGAFMPAQAASTVVQIQDEPTLGKLLAKLGVRSPGQVLPDGQDAIWTTGNNANITLAFEFSANRNTNRFGLYDINDPDRRIELFSGSSRPHASVKVSLIANEQGGYDVTVGHGKREREEVFSSAHFGFYLTTTENHGETFFSHTALNNDGADHMQAFLYGGAGIGRVLEPKTHKSAMKTGYVLAWEDAFRGGDGDYQDLVISVRSFAPVPLPPAIAMAMSGLALLGFVGWRRRQET